MTNAGNVGLNLAVPASPADGLTFACTGGLTALAGGEMCSCKMAVKATQADFEAAFVTLQANRIEATRIDNKPSTVPASSASIMVPLDQRPALDLQVALSPATATRGGGWWPNCSHDSVMLITCIWSDASARNVFALLLHKPEHCCTMTVLFPTKCHQKRPALRQLEATSNLQKTCLCASAALQIRR